ncbi:hypothetical protein LCGC14_0372880 [marine sediment metagenome]|uniref:Uncharacterized protein n=1 Tax=marine sediment metagenome TaxID=412755 RepID=A0A0F9TMW9_9ZZZZ
MLAQGGREFGDVFTFSSWLCGGKIRMPLDDNKPPLRVEFTKTEQTEMQRTCIMIQQTFLRAHQEIIAPSNSDLTTMIRQEKQMYANLGIAFAVDTLAAIEKAKKK